MIVITQKEKLQELREMFASMKTIDVLGEDFVIEIIEVLNEEARVKLVQVRKFKQFTFSDYIKHAMT